MSSVATAPAPAPPTNKAARRRAFLIFFVVLLAIGASAFAYWLHARNFQDTDDAQVDGHLNPISSRVEGTIAKVYVEDNTFVKAGQPLADLDPRDFQVALDQANAQYAQANTQVVVQRPNVPITEAENATNISTADAEVTNAQAALAAAERDCDTSQARLAQSEATNARAQADLARYQVLISKEEVSQQEFDQISSTAKAQAADVTASEAALGSAKHVVDQRRAQLLEAQSRLAQYRRTAPEALAIRRASVQSEQAAAQTAQAQLEQAKLNLSYTRIVAPVDGIVLRRSAEVGAHVTAGQQLFQIAQVNDLWVTADFKETQTREIHPGQPVTIHVDALKQDFRGSVETIGATTGAVASVLPPENATGNYVKVVQRLPVRIRFEPDQNGMDRLRPGMSVEPKVQIQ